MIAQETPLRKWHEEYAASIDSAAEFIPYGVSEGSVGDPLCSIIATYGPVEAEYASIRRGAGIMDRPERATIRITGEERVEFLNHMLTQELKAIEPGIVRESFWLDRSGRVVADLLLVETQEHLLVDIDIAQRESFMESIESFLFSEDVSLVDATESLHRLSIHGARSLEVLAAITRHDPYLLAPLACKSDDIEGIAVTIARRDQTGDIGLELFVPRASVQTVWSRLLETDEQIAEGKRRIRPIGWSAYNMARIEGGTPLMNVDFGVTNLPHESGVLGQRVSFTKGCYLGQEIVARMESRGKPKQSLVGLRCEGEVLPIAGAQVFTKEEPSADPIGVITSSTLSPMLGAQPIAFGMLRTKHAAIDDDVIVNTEEGQSQATVGELEFWSHA